jgi:hypothetical protein
MATVQVWLGRGLIGLCLAGLAPATVRAAEVECAVGARVQGEFGGGEIGTIAEIGSQPPHVGAYRITFGWSPAGEWYYPQTWTIHPAGSPDRCVINAAAAGMPAPAATHAPSADASSDHVLAADSAAIASTERCRSGAAVRDRKGKLGSVLGEDNGMCVVRLEDGSKASYLAWMLDPTAAGSGPAVGGALAVGDYVCSTEGAGQLPLRIVDGTSYLDRAGSAGHYSLRGDRIQFASGSLAGYYARVLGQGKFGLSSGEVRTFYVVCNRKS